jgi:hypothetical protein
MQFNNPTSIKNMTTRHLRRLIGGSPLRLGFLLIPLALVCFALSASLALADDFKTIAGKEYKDATVTRVEPDGILVKYKSGISKLYFVELPKEVQERFHYDPQQATAYSAGQAANYEVYQKQQEEVRRRQEDADAHKKAMIGEQQAGNDRAQALQDRELGHEQQKALQQANRPRPEHTPKYTTVLHQLPVVHSQATPQDHQTKKNRSRLPAENLRRA